MLDNLKETIKTLLGDSWSDEIDVYFPSIVKECEEDVFLYLGEDCLVNIHTNVSFLRLLKCKVGIQCIYIKYAYSPSEKYCDALKRQFESEYAEVKQELLNSVYYDFIIG